jgi:acetyl-CoA carboxylase/biotin carboxylase 1
VQAEGSPGADAAIKAREAALLPVYHQVAVQFAQMHDGPVRMLAKGALRGIVPWAQSRAFFAARLRRRLTEEALLKHISAADASVGRRQALELLRDWYLSTAVDPPTSPARGAAPTAAAAAASSSCAPAAATDGVQLACTLAAGSGAAAAERAWQDDGAFMAWAQGAGGAARIALELRQLRTGAAAALVAELAGTGEGTEGLVAGLRQAVQSNPSLVLQLRSLVAPRQ